MLGERETTWEFHVFRFKRERLILVSSRFRISHTIVYIAYICKIPLYLAGIIRKKNYINNRTWTQALANYSRELLGYTYYNLLIKLKEWNLYKNCLASLQGLGWLHNLRISCFRVWRGTRVETLRAIDRSQVREVGPRYYYIILLPASTLFSISLHLQKQIASPNFDFPFLSLVWLWERW